MSDSLQNKIIVAIDGHSSCGKSTMAKDLAREVGYVYVDSGAMYRAVALYAMREGLLLPDGAIDEVRLREAMPGIAITFALNEATGMPDTYLNGVCVERDIRTLAVSALVSPVATLPFVREALMQQQRSLGLAKGIVMDGRDVGTAIFPEAELKVFVTASPEVRARRRYDELTAKGESVNYDDILANVNERDYIDTHRALNPLVKADDALTLDNSHLTIAEQREWLLARFAERTS